MDATTITHKESTPRSGAVVMLAKDMLGVQAPDGTTVYRDRLGPGIVESTGPDGRLHVLWVGSNIQVWMVPADVQFLGEQARLVSVYRRDEEGHKTLIRRGVVSTAGLTDNWIVEWLPNNVVRALRSDGSCWTYQWDPILDRMHKIHTRNVLRFAPPDDEDAEAITVAELSKSDLDIKDVDHNWQWAPVDF